MRNLSKNNALIYNRTLLFSCLNRSHQLISLFVLMLQPNDQMSLVAVMLYDFQARKFLPRKSRGNKEIIQEVRDVENYLLR